MWNDPFLATSPARVNAKAGAGVANRGDERLVKPLVDPFFNQALSALRRRATVAITPVAIAARA